MVHAALCAPWTLQGSCGIEVAGLAGLPPALLLRARARADALKRVTTAKLQRAAAGPASTGAVQVTGLSAQPGVQPAGSFTALGSGGAVSSLLSSEVDALHWLQWAAAAASQLHGQQGPAAAAAGAGDVMNAWRSAQFAIQCLQGV